MGRCVDRPDRETSFMCMKDSVYLCEERFGAGTVMRKLPAALREGGWKVKASIVKKRYANEEKADLAG